MMQPPAPDDSPLKATSAATSPVRADALMRPVPSPVVAANGVHWLPVPGWEKYPWLRAGFSTRKGGLSRVYLSANASADTPGELNLGFTPDDDPQSVRGNRELLCEAVAGHRMPLIALRQIHSPCVIRSSAADLQREAPCEADGHFTAQPGLMLAVQTADCIPVLVADTRQKIVAGFHAGWRGTVQRIVELGVEQLVKQCGSRPEDLVAAIGPGVGPCCYAVGTEVVAAFTAQFGYAGAIFHQVQQGEETATHLDLIEANRRQLLAAGLRPEAIQIVSGCTHCRQDLFFSYRGSGGKTGRMMAVIGVLPGE